MPQLSKKHKLYKSIKSDAMNYDVNVSEAGKGFSHRQHRNKKGLRFRPSTNKKKLLIFSLRAGDKSEL